MQLTQGIAVATLAFCSVSSIVEALPFVDHHFHNGYSHADDSKKRDAEACGLIDTKMTRHNLHDAFKRDAEPDPVAFADPAFATPRSVVENDHEGYKRDPNALKRPPEARDAEPAFATPRSVPLEDLVSIGWKEAASKRDAEAAAMLPPHFQPPMAARPQRRGPIGTGRGRGR